MLVGVLIFLILGMINGYKKGFLRIVITLAGLLVVLFVIAKAAPIVTNYVIDNTQIDDKVREKVVERYAEYREEKDNLTGNVDALRDEESEDDIVSEDAPSDNQISGSSQTTVAGSVQTTVSGSSQTIEDKIRSMGLPEIITGALISNNTEEVYDTLAVNLFEEYIAEYISRLIIKAGVFVSLFVVLGIIWWILLATTKLLEKIKPLRFVNKLLGTVTGLVCSLLIVWALSFLVLMFWGGTVSNWMIQNVNSSVILSYIFNNNPLFVLIS